MSTATLSRPFQSAAEHHDSLLLRLLQPAPRVDLISTWHPERSLVEAHVSERYLQSYQAQVDQFLPWLLRLECLGNISGVAPRAQIIAYKVCGSVPGTASCFGSDSVAAVEQAAGGGVP